MNMFKKKIRCDGHCLHDAGMYFVAPAKSSHGPYEPRKAEKVKRCCHCGTYMDRDNAELITTDNVFCLRRAA